MKPLVKWGLRLLLALILAAVVVGVTKREEITRLMAVNTLFEEDRILRNFSNMRALFRTVPVPRGDGPVSDLPKGAPMDLPPQAAQWINDRAVTSLLVLHEGRIVHERYHLGTNPEDRRISWSMAKSFLSALFGVIEAEGAIGSLDDPVTDYVPRLAGTAYDGVTIRHVLQMTSGVAFDEDYLDRNSDINRMGRVLALGGTMDGFAANLMERAAPPGERWQYVSIDTHVLGMVLRAATGRDLPSLLSEKIIAPLGLERDPYYITDGEGVAFALGGLNLTTRDYARFGLMFARGGAYDGRQIVPQAWVRASTSPSAPTPPGALRYGYQWWIPKDGPDGVFMARGIYGQYIYIDPGRDVVIVATGADRAFRQQGVHDSNIAIFRSIAAAL